ncbi:hypothetical protein PYCCODRAFT_1373710 [Trametes coccinea BRFM310]|uniref:Uncharacterized protein n=1 Tax=Trametes coccinea (strain BRFM310) TaxID=1353009 RepID=A0A1Y2IDR7_TRAC3|nr:hypothetical protein PYCCODRAFT_1373710 [Trametes coccinea BRFM310]
MAALAALPVELLDAVLSPLSHNLSALAAAALSCSALNPSATRLLYRHLSLSAYAHNVGVVGLLAARPDLAALVRTFSVHLDDADAAVLPTYADLQRALALMTNLTSLALYVDATASWILSPPLPQQPQRKDKHREGEKAREREQSDILEPVPAFYPRLEHLTCNFPLDAHLAAFLGQVPALISLQLSSLLSDQMAGATGTQSEPELDPAVVQVSPSHIPLLEAYTGPAYVLPSLASRPLRAVHLSGDLTLDLLPSASAPSPEPASSALRPAGAPSSSELDRHHASGSRADTDNSDLLGADSDIDTGALLQVMSAMTSAAPAQLLEALALAYPNLVCLRLMTTRALWDLPDLAFYSRIADTLSTLPHLSAFELSGIHWQSRRKSPSPAPSSSSASSSASSSSSVSESAVGSQAAATEWISPPVSPRAAELPPDDEEDLEDRDYDFDGAFLDWSY